MVSVYREDLANRDDYSQAGDFTLSQLLTLL